MSKIKLVVAILLMNMTTYNVSAESNMKNINEVLAGLKVDVINYCKNAANNNEAKEIDKIIEQKNKNGSPYKLGGNTQIEEHEHLSAPTPQECYSSQTNLLDNVFKQYYQRISEKEFIDCYNKTANEENTGIYNFESCIEDIKKKECAPVLKKEFKDVYERAMEYSKCIDS